MTAWSRFGVQGLLQSAGLLGIFAGSFVLVVRGDDVAAGVFRLGGIVAAATIAFAVILVVLAVKRRRSNRFQKQFAMKHPDALVFGSGRDKNLLAQLRPFTTYDQWSSLDLYFSVVGDSAGLKIFGASTSLEPDISISWGDVAGDVRPVRVQHERGPFNGIWVPLNSPSLPPQLDLVVLGGGLGGVFAVSRDVTAWVSEEMNRQQKR